MFEKPSQAQKENQSQNQKEQIDPIDHQKMRESFFSKKVIESLKNGEVTPEGLKKSLDAAMAVLEGSEDAVEGAADKLQSVERTQKGKEMGQYPSSASALDAAFLSSLEHSAHPAEELKRSKKLIDLYESVKDENPSALHIIEETLKATE